MISSILLPEVRLLLILLSTPFIVFIVHVILIRVRPGISRQLTAVQAILASAAPLALTTWSFALKDFSPPEMLPAILYSLILYGCLANTYFHFFNMSETARRIRILYEVYRAGSLSPTVFESLYKTTDIINIRLIRLVDMKQLRQEEGVYMIGRKTLLRAAQFVVIWRRLLGLETENL